jgi:hypothetical protein
MQLFLDFYKSTQVGGSSRLRFGLGVAVVVRVLAAPRHARQPTDESTNQPIPDKHHSMTTTQHNTTQHNTTQPPSSPAALQCVILLSSVRRSLFATDKERAAFLQQLVSAIRDILQTEKGLEYQVRGLMQYVYV